MTLRIISTEDVVFDGDVTMVVLPGVEGEFTVLNNHAALISALIDGNVRYKLPDGSESAVDINGGVVNVDNNIVSVCVF